MARRKKGGAKTAEAAAPEEAAKAAEAPRTGGGDSARVVAACASIGSASQIAVTELQAHAAPFLSFAQKAKIGALATNFENTGFGAAPVRAAPTSQVVEGGLSRDQIEQIVGSAVETAVNSALLRIGATADEPLRDQVERQVDSQISAQEHRLLEYVKKHLVDSLEMIEESLDDRIADYFEGHEVQREAELEQQRTREEVDKQVEEAKDNLLQSIDEVRSIDVGFDISEFAAGLSEVVGADQSVEGMEVVGEAAEIEVAGEEIELGGEEIELGGEEEIELGEADETETGDADVSAGLEGVEDSIIVEAAAEDGDGDSIEIEVAEEGPAIELGEADPGVETIDRSEAADGDEPVTLDLDVSGAEEAVEIELGDEDEVEIEIGDDDEYEATAISAPLEEDEVVEEISVIREVGEEGDVDVEVGLEVDEGDLVELDLGELDDEDDNPALMTLGTGPEDIESISVAEISEAYEVEAIEDDPEGDSEESTARTIERYLQRAAEMRARNQSAAAMELYSKVLDIDGDNYEARVGRGVVHLEAKDYKRSVDEFTRAEAIDPSRPAGALGLAEVHFHRKQFNKAIRHYTRCLKLDDKLAQAYCNRGLSYYYQKNYKKAFLDLMKAYDLDSELPNIKKYLKLVRNKVKTDK